MTRFCFVGNACIDQIDDEPLAEGGASMYGAALASLLGMDASIVTRLANDFKKESYPKINWIVQLSNESTKYIHRYKEEERNSILANRTDPIEIQKIPNQVRKADLVMICPIIDEVSPQVIDKFTSQWVGLSPQGWFRSFDEYGHLLQKNCAYSGLPKKIKLIVVSQSDLFQDKIAWSWIKDSCEIAVQTLGKQGYILHQDGQEKKYSPPKIFDAIDSTGCGDIFATSLLYLLYQGISWEKSAEVASYAAGLASTQKGIINSVTMAANHVKPLLKI